MKNKESVGNAVVGAKEEVMQIFAVKQSGSLSLFTGDPITNEFIKLDNEIRIDKDNKEVKKFKKIVCSFVKISAI